MVIVALLSVAFNPEPAPVTAVVLGLVGLVAMLTVILTTPKGA